MAIGAREFVDRLLVEKYSQEKVDNHNEDALVSKISAEDMMQAMDTSSQTYRTMLALNTRLTGVCYGIVSKGARYNEYACMR